MHLNAQWIQWYSSIVEIFRIVIPYDSHMIPKGFLILDPDRCWWPGLRVTYGPNLDPKWREASRLAREAVFGDYLKLIQRANESRFDVVLIDGRVRGESAIAALPYVDERSVVIIHDWFLEEWGYEFLPDGTQDFSKAVKVAPRNRLKSYRQVLDFYDVVCRVSPETHPLRCSRAGLVVLRKKPQANPNEAWWVFWFRANQLLYSLLRWGWSAKRKCSRWWDYPMVFGKDTSMFWHGLGKWPREQPSPGRSYGLRSIKRDVLMTSHP